MRASAPSGASASGAGARSATPQSADASAGSKSFSDLLVGTPARAAGADPTSTATGGKPSPKSIPPSNGDGKSASPKAATDSKAEPAAAGDATAAPKNASAPDSTAAASASAAAAPGGTDATAAATVSSLIGATVNPPEADDAGAAAPVPSGKPAGRRTAVTDAAAASASASARLMSAQSMWLMAAAGAATSGAAAAAPAPPATPATSTSSDSLNAATALGALTGNTGAADPAPISPSSTGSDNNTAADAASPAPSVLSEFQAGPAALGTTTDEDASGDSDASDSGAQASSDRARASTDVSSGDLSSLAQLVRGASPGNAQTGGIERSIGTPVTDPGWSRDVAAQVQMMASAKVQSATLRLSPEHLGPVEVHIDMQSSQINVNFVAAHPDTRSALEQSVPTLRAMLAHGGLTLGQTQVQGEARSGSQSAGSRARDNALAAPGEEPIAVAAVRNAGLIDEYA